MLFNSFSFILFFSIVTTFYYLLPFKFRWAILLLASCIFYTYFIPVYIFILFYLIVVDYIAAICIEKLKGKKRKLFLLLSITSNVGVLFFFKYFNFFGANVSSLARIIHWNYQLPLLALILPIGLSFHTFQSLSYVIEVYKKKYKAEKHLGVYALYVMFYPQLVAGPIERPQQLLPQFKVKHSLVESNITEGLKRMILGLFKKVVIADRLAILVNQIYGTPHDYIGMPLIIATLAFAIQIYCDFSGYSDIAIGAARVMGINLMENFNFPYLAKSVSDFWRRWHISLYQWFRDYVYIPLGGSKNGLARHIFNILIVFAITGLWHGASWTFVFWGALHGIYLSSETLLKKLFSKLVPEFKGVLKKFSTGAQILLTFLLVCISWIFFRANSFPDGFYILTNIPKGLGAFFKSLATLNITGISGHLFGQGKNVQYGLGLNVNELLLVIGAITALIILEYILRNHLLIRLPNFARWGIYILITLAVINLGSTNQIPFIYFQF